MSVVIAIKHKNKIYMGCDTQVSRLALGAKSDLQNESQKIWHHADLPNLILGSVGSLRNSQILQTNVELFDPLAILTNKLDFTYMVNEFFTKVLEILKEKNRVEYTEQGQISNYIDNQIIVGFNDRMYLVDGEGTVIESDDYLVIGSGEFIATGVLETNKNKKPEERIREAIQACADKTLYVNNSITIINT